MTTQSLASTPNGKQLITHIDEVIPAGTKDRVNPRDLVINYLGPSVILTLGDKLLRQVVDEPETLLKRFVGGDRVGFKYHNTSCYECGCSRWGRAFDPKDSNYIPPRGIFEGVLLHEITQRFPDRAQPLRIGIIGSGAIFRR